MIAVTEWHYYSWKMTPEEWHTLADHMEPAWFADNCRTYARNPHWAMAVYADRHAWLLAAAKRAGLAVAVEGKDGTEEDEG